MDYRQHGCLRHSSGFPGMGMGEAPAASKMAPTKRSHGTQPHHLGLLAGWAHRHGWHLRPWSGQGGAVGLSWWGCSFSLATPELSLQSLSC